MEARELGEKIKVLEKSLANTMKSKFLKPTTGLKNESLGSLSSLSRLGPLYNSTTLSTPLKSPLTPPLNKTLLAESFNPSLSFRLKNITERFYYLKNKLLLYLFIGALIIIFFIILHSFWVLAPPNASLTPPPFETSKTVEVEIITEKITQKKSTVEVLIPLIFLFMLVLLATGKQLSTIYI